MSRQNVTNQGFNDTIFQNRPTSHISSQKRLEDEEKFKQNILNVLGNIRTVISESDKHTTAIGLALDKNVHQVATNLNNISNVVSTIITSMKQLNNSVNNMSYGNSSSSVKGSNVYDEEDIKEGTTEQVKSLIIEYDNSTEEKLQVDLVDNSFFSVIEETIFEEKGPEKIDQQDLGLDAHYYEHLKENIELEKLKKKQEQEEDSFFY